MSVSENGILSVDTQNMESLLQAIDQKLMYIDEKMEILVTPEEDIEETETVSDNSILIYEAVQGLEMRVDTQIKIQIAGIIALLIAACLAFSIFVYNMLPK